MRCFAIVAAMLLAAGSGHADTLSQQLAGMTVGTWRAIASSNTLASIDPGKDAAVNPNYPAAAPWEAGGYRNLWEAWNSGGLDTGHGACGSIVYYGGGHSDYWGNEVVSVDLCAPGGPTWSRLSNPYPGPFVWPSNNGAFPDGTPAMPHTYDTIAVGGGYLTTLVSMIQPAVSSAKVTYTFDLSAHVWTGPYVNQGAIEGSSTWDSRRNLVWYGTAGEVRYDRLVVATAPFMAAL